MSVLLQTLYAASYGSTSFLSQTGLGTRAQATIAQLKDASDGTYSDFKGVGDGFDQDSIQGYENFTLDTPSLGGYTPNLVRITIRAKKDANWSSASIRPRINNVAVGTAQNLTTSFVDYTFDFAVDPNDSNPWSEAKLAQLFGWCGGAASNEYGVTSTVSSTGHILVSEFKVEAFAPDPQTSTEPAIELALAVPGGSEAPGGVVTTEAAIAMAVIAAAGVGFGGTCEPVLGTRIPDALTTKLGTLDGGSTPAVVRAKNSALKDQRLDTYVSASSGVGPTTETLSVETDGPNPDDVSGAGAISYIVMHALARMREGDGASVHRPTATNARFAWGAGSALMTSPPSGAYDAVPDFAECVSGPIYTRSGTDAWTWADLGQPAELGPPSGWQVKVDVDITDVGDLAQLDVAEVWLEVHAPVGTKSQAITVRQRIGKPIRKTYKLKGSI